MSINIKLVMLCNLLLFINLPRKLYLKPYKKTAATWMTAVSAFAAIINSSFLLHGWNGAGILPSH